MQYSNHDAADTVFPRHRAAASLKHGWIADWDREHALAVFPRHRAAASLKRPYPGPVAPAVQSFSAASGRGLIEAMYCQDDWPVRVLVFPRHRAAASLKQLADDPAWKPGMEFFRGIGPRPH